MTKPLLAVLLTAALLPVARAELNYGFDSGAQGFSASNGTLSWVAGAGGGWLSVRDRDSSNDMLLNFPDLGDWSSYRGGTLSFDARNASDPGATDPDWSHFGETTFAGAGLSVTQDLVAAGQPAADGQWHHFTVQLTDAHFGANLPLVLAALSSATLNVEFHQTFGTDYETVELDNIRVAAVPEPASAVLWLAGAAALGWRLRRRFRRR